MRRQIITYFAATVIALTMFNNCRMTLPTATATPANTSTPQVTPATFPTTTLVLPTAAPTRTSSALSSLQIHSIVLSGHTGSITNLAWLPDGKLLASASNDKTARLWRSVGTLLAVLSDHTAEVNALAWSPDGKVLATGWSDGTMRLWRTDGTPFITLQSTGDVVPVAWSPDDKTLASGSSFAVRKNPVQLWRPADGKLLRTLYTDETPGNLAWSPDGNFVAAGGIDYKLWSAEGTEIIITPVELLLGRSPGHPTAKPG